MTLGMIALTALTLYALWLVGTVALMEAWDRIVDLLS